MKKTVISFCVIALAAATFISCQKETARPSNSLNAGAVSNATKGQHGFTGGTGTTDSTKATTQP